MIYFFFFSRSLHSRWWVFPFAAPLFNHCHWQNSNWINCTNSHLTCVWNIFLTLPKTDNCYHLHTSNEVFIFIFIFLGMDQTYCDKVEYMTDYFPQINFYMYQGPAPRIRSRNIPQDFFSCKYKGNVEGVTIVTQVLTAR